MTPEQISQELRDSSHNIGVLERTEVGMGNAKEVLKGYRKVLRDLHSTVESIWNVVKEIKNV